MIQLIGYFLPLFTAFALGEDFDRKSTHFFAKNTIKEAKSGTKIRKNTLF